MLQQGKTRWFPVNGNICGRCEGCGHIYPANGLAPTQDRYVFGEFEPNRWECESCSPKLFGNISGRTKFAEIGAARIVTKPRLVKTAAV